MKNAGVKVLVLSFVFVFMFSGLAHAMTYQEFMDMYPNDYIYRVDFPTGSQNYLSSPCELEFRLQDTWYGTVLQSGKAFVVYKTAPCTVYRLRADGEVRSFSGEYIELIANTNDYVGYEGDIDIYRWNGYSFFLPEPSAFLRGLGGPIRTILLTGFGIVSVMLLVKLLAVYWKRFVHRSL